MPFQARNRLMTRLLLVYVAVSLFGVVIITLHNLFINDLPLSDFFRFRFTIKLLLGCMLVLVFQFISYVRLKPVLRFLDTNDRKYRAAAWRRLLRFPVEIFWGMIIYGVIVSPIYHFAAIALKNSALQAFIEHRLLYFIENVLFDQALTLTLASLFYVVLRRVCRVYLHKIEYYDIDSVKPSSFALPLITAYVSQLCISFFSVLWYIINSAASGRELHMPTLVSIITVTSLLGIALLSMHALELRNGFRGLIASIRGLIAGQREQLHGKMPVVSRDEAGQLAAAFNSLQEQTSRAYAEVEQELALAHNVQQMLLPETNHEFRSLQISGMCRPIKEIGGDYFDVIDLRDGRIAVAVGDVSGNGIQAALIMSTVVVLLRSEIRRGGTAAEVLGRLNRILMDTLNNIAFVTMGLGIFDTDKASFEYSSAGHVSPYLLNGMDSSVKPLDCPSLPLGIDQDVIYDNITLTYRPGDRFIFYTDGIVEAVNADGEMLSFGELERYLAALDRHKHPELQIQELMDRIPSAVDSSRDDDRTLMIVQIANM